MALILRNGTRAWRNGILPYRIKNSGFTAAALNNINRAIDHWNSNTNWQINQRTTQRDFVEFRVGQECSSPVGRQGGRQFINLANNCGFGASVHEIGHAIGFHHEHNRGDRNNFVIVMRDRINPDAYSRNFIQVSQEEYLDHGDYDFDSIMHYSRRAFLRTKRYDWSAGWTTSEFYEANGNTYLFLLKAANGIVHVHDMGGNFDFVGREIERHDWSNDWTNVRFYSIRNRSFMFLLKSGNGKVHIHQTNNEGTVGRQIQRQDWSDGWTTSEFYEVNGNTFLFLLKAGNGRVHIHRMNNNGTLGRQIERHDWSSGWTNVEFYEVAGRIFMFLLKTRSGRVHIHQINSNGTVGNEVQRYNWSSGWTTSEFYSINGRTYLFLLKVRDGIVHIHRMNNNGTVGRQIQSFDWSSGWTNIRFYTSGTAKYMWLLKSGSGIVHIHRMNNNGTVGRETTISPKMTIYSPRTIGQRRGLSAGDIAAANDRV